MQSVFSDGVEEQIQALFNNIITILTNNLEHFQNEEAAHNAVESFQARFKIRTHLESYSYVYDGLDIMEFDSRFFKPQIDIVEDFNEDTGENFAVETVRFSAFINPDIVKRLTDSDTNLMQEYMELVQKLNSNDIGKFNLLNEFLASHPLIKKEC